MARQYSMKLPNRSRTMLPCIAGKPMVMSGENIAITFVRTDYLLGRAHQAVGSEGVTEAVFRPSLAWAKLQPAPELSSS